VAPRLDQALDEDGRGPKELTGMFDLTRDAQGAHWPASRSHWRKSQAGNACPRFVPNAVHAMRAEPLDSGCQHAARAPGETRADLGVKRLGHPIACHACPKTLRSHAFSRRMAHRLALGNSFDGLADRDRRRPERMAALRGMVDLDPQHWSRREPTLLGTGVCGRRTLDERPSASVAGCKSFSGGVRVWRGR